MVVADYYLSLIHHHVFARGKPYKTKPKQKRSSSSFNIIISFKGAPKL